MKTAPLLTVAGAAAGYWFGTRINPMLQVKMPPLARAGAYAAVVASPAFMRSAFKPGIVGGAHLGLAAMSAWSLYNYAKARIVGGTSSS